MNRKLKKPLSVYEEKKETHAIKLLESERQS